jgi:hypothetical protein
MIYIYVNKIIILHVNWPIYYMIGYVKSKGDIKQLTGYIYTFNHQN